MKSTGGRKNPLCIVRRNFICLLLIISSICYLRASLSDSHFRLCCSASPLLYLCLIFFHSFERLCYILHVLIATTNLFFRFFLIHSFQIYYLKIVRLIPFYIHRSVLISFSVLFDNAAFAAKLNVLEHPMKWFSE